MSCQWALPLDTEKPDTAMIVGRFRETEMETEASPTRHERLTIGGEDWKCDSAAQWQLAFGLQSETGKSRSKNKVGQRLGMITEMSQQTQT